MGLVSWRELLLKLQTWCSGLPFSSANRTFLLLRLDLLRVESLLLSADLSFFVPLFVTVDPDVFSFFLPKAGMNFDAAAAPATTTTVTVCSECRMWTRLLFTAEFYRYQDPRTSPFYKPTRIINLFNLVISCLLWHRKLPPKKVQAAFRVEGLTVAAKALCNTNTLTLASFSFLNIILMPSSALCSPTRLSQCVHHQLWCKDTCTRRPTFLLTTFELG